MIFQSNIKDKMLNKFSKDLNFIPFIIKKNAKKILHEIIFGGLFLGYLLSLIFGSFGFLLGFYIIIKIIQNEDKKSDYFINTEK